MSLIEFKPRLQNVAWIVVVDSLTMYSSAYYSMEKTSQILKNNQNVASF